MDSLIGAIYLKKVTKYYEGKRKNESIIRRYLTEIQISKTDQKKRGLSDPIQKEWRKYSTRNKRYFRDNRVSV